MKTVTVTGYLTQEKLAEAVRTLVGDRWTGIELRVAGTKRRWDMGFSDGARRVVVEFDGDAHYRDALKIKADAEKDAIAKADGIHVVRFPYWVQLDQVTLRHYFALDAIIRQDFPHGFITTKLFPASFCEMGVRRFERELADLPAPVRDAVARSLVDRVREHGNEYVLPRDLRHLVG